ncbi:MAG: hypothetical protein LBF27_13095 [Sphingobacterium sp.]|jgi:hypothetical protein|nr:hypothetical protein [Sphingobacterium sp.]
METKKTQTIMQGKSPYEAPEIKVENIVLEYSVAAGSVQSGTVQQQWDAEESSTSSQNEGWW